eukprot:scaffold602_cov298-Pinguiococcus_pyrenoidosus.AAC.5
MEILRYRLFRSAGATDASLAALASFPHIMDSRRSIAILSSTLLSGVLLGALLTSQLNGPSSATASLKPPQWGQAAGPYEMLAAQPRRRLQQEPYAEYFEILEDFLPEDGMHQEGASCQWGKKLLLVGGIAVTGQHAVDTGDVEPFSWGGNKFHVFDMETREVVEGPDAPDIGNHMACAVSPDGILHVTGGFWQARKRSPKSYSRHWVIDLKDPAAQWDFGPRMPEPRGAHSCQFLADGKMYCAGGGLNQIGPFLPNLFIFDPATNQWSYGPEMNQGRDHTECVAMFNGTRLFVFGGRSDYVREPGTPFHPVYWATVDTVEMYDIHTKRWKFLSPLQFARGKSALGLYDRHGSGQPNVLIAGGEKFLSLSGVCLSSIEEYDTTKGVYYCHPPLPFPFFGGASGVYDGKFFVLGGADWFGIAGTRRLQILDLKKAPAPEPCAYMPQQDTLPWDKHFLKSIPSPYADDIMSQGAQVFSEMTRTLYDLVPQGAAQEETTESPYEERLRRKGRESLVGF